MVTLNIMDFGTAEIQGRRPSMEDKQVYLSLRDGTIKYSAVYDGHGGSEAAIYLANNLHKQIERDLDLDNIELSLNKIFHKVDESLIKRTNAGSTAVIVIIIDNNLYCANVGDSEAYLIKEDIDDQLNVITLMEMHNCKNSREIKRINDLDGFIYCDRVFGSLAVTRSFGDALYKKPYKNEDYVSVNPYISKILLDDKCKYIILACDGLWDVCNKSDVAQIIYKKDKEGYDLDFIAEYLTSYAFALKSTDNITVQIIKLK